MATTSPASGPSLGKNSARAYPAARRDTQRREPPMRARNPKK